MEPAVELLSRQMDDAFAMLNGQLDGLTEEEFLWEPVPGSWSLRQMPEGRWTYDYAVPDPKPSPFTTIAWRLNNVSTSKIMYHEYAFGPGELTFPDLDIPHTVAGQVAFLKEGHTLLTGDLRGLAEADLQEPRLTNWGEEWPTWRIFWTMIHHDIWHGAEIGVIRDLYRSSVAVTT